MKDKCKRLIMRFLSPGEKMIIFSIPRCLLTGPGLAQIVLGTPKKQFGCERRTSGREFLNYEETVDQSGEKEAKRFRKFDCAQMIGTRWI